MSDEFVREGARQMLAAALQAEVAAYVEVHADALDADGHRRRRFSSAILPAWSRKSPQVAEVLPLPYLHGLSSSEFVPAREQFLGSSAALSAATITRLTGQWQQDAAAFPKRSPPDSDYVYLSGSTASTSRCALSRTRSACSS